LGGVAFETALEFEHRLRAVPRRPAAALVEATIDEHKPVANGPIERWELHSELALVCPEVRRRALELLPERDPDSFLTGLQAPVSLPAGTIDEAQRPTSLPVAVVGYAFWRLIETARSAVIAIGAAVALALFAEMLH
jgi:hypothetical protein